ncbi:MAG: ASCH domain-containing protein [Bacteroidota bacterium]
MSKTLHLTLKKKWFCMIKSGEKKEEYREIKKYWASRLLHNIPLYDGGYLSAWGDIEDGDYEAQGWKDFSGNAPVYKDFTHAQFRNGYRKDSPSITVPIKNIRIGKGRPEWGAEIDTNYFIIELGEIEL